MDGIRGSTDFTHGRSRDVVWTPPRLLGFRRTQTCGSAKHRGFSRSSLWTMLIVAVALLTMINVFISFKLTHYVDIGRGSGDRLTNTNDTPSDCNGIVSSLDSLRLGRSIISTSRRTTAHNDGRFRFVNGSGRFDDSRKYVIHDAVQVSDDWAQLGATRLVCLATQTSVDRLRWIVEVCRHWQGPVSAAVFVPGEDFQVAFRYLAYLRRCFPEVRAMATFHFVYPSQHFPIAGGGVDDEGEADDDYRLSCDTTETVALNILAKRHPRAFRQWRGTLLYPQNHLRNVARKGCPTPYVFLTDVDVVPRPGLGPSLDQFLAYPPCDHCAFVVPTYEVDEKVSMPRNKSMLLQLVRDKRAQSFHKVIFINNQFATNVTQWETIPEGTEVSVAYPVTNFELFYEPFYVARDDVPPHDTRFVGYGFTRNSQVYEMFVANFKFLVLNYAFAVHRGLKRRKTKNSWREKQNRANSRLFKKFEREILARHGYAVAKKP